MGLFRTRYREHHSSRRRGVGGAALLLLLLLAVGLVVVVYALWHWIRLAVLAALVVALVRGAVKLARYLRADRETRRSILQARRIRRRWRKLSLMLGLAVVDPAPRGLARILHHGDGPRVVVPKLRTRTDEYGVMVTAQTVPRIGKEAWQKSASHLANAWGCVRVAVTQDEPGRLVSAPCAGTRSRNPAPTSRAGRLPRT